MLWLQLVIFCFSLPDFWFWFANVNKPFSEHAKYKQLQQSHPAVYMFCSFYYMAGVGGGELKIKNLGHLLSPSTFTGTSLYPEALRGCKTFISKQVMSHVNHHPTAIKEMVNLYFIFPACLCKQCKFKILPYNFF